MTQRFVVTLVTKPTSVELQNAIAQFSDDVPKTLSDDVVKAGLAIIGEACSYLEEGKTSKEVIFSLGKLGLSVGCATTFVEKATEVVQSNRQLALESDQARFSSKLMNASLIIGVVLVVLVVVALLVATALSQ